MSGGADALSGKVDTGSAQMGTARRERGGLPRSRVIGLGTPGPGIAAIVQAPLCAAACERVESRPEILTVLNASAAP